MGIIMIFLLTCGRNASARSLGLVNFKPFMASSAFPALPTLSVPFRKQRNKQRCRALDGSEPGSFGFSLVSNLIPIIFHPHFFTQFSFFRDNDHIPGPREIRGMLPFSLAPPTRAS
ncbi:hypothetical protein [uncultured Desulfovibrio sp.]|uniref:hypothetical protein n=1 Tax=uncultured Desulfovibrio sp. TaxID=167968 RepID=UPI00039A6D5D|nr:hypothetical protein [uncultured Desulfovibrio sp.]